MAEYAEKCSWRAGAFLAAEMKKDLFNDWERGFAAVEGDTISGYCTLAKTDCALAYAKTLGFDKVYLVSGEQGLYEKYGFIKLEDKKDRGGRDEQIFFININSFPQHL